MNKEELVRQVAKKVDIPQGKVHNCVNAMVESVTEALSDGEKVTLVGFGTFSVRERAARNGVNPRTKKALKIPSKTVPVFRPGKELKEKVSK